ncbi:MAG: VWA domain-containing protein [Myxococcota bacterium]
MIAALAWFACSGSGTVPQPGLEPVQIRVDYGSEKKAWLEDAIARFEAANPTLPSGRPIDVVTRSLGSGEAVADIAAGRSQPHVFSPASSAYLSLLDDQWLSVPGHTKPLAGAAEPIVLSPVVIALWRPMAEALGWPDRPVSWADLLTIAQDPAGWGAHGHPEWGRFKLAHTDPRLSNSGLLAVLSETYAAVHLTRGLTAESLAAAEPFVASVEASLVHYGKSTGFVHDKMLERGPSYVSAVVSYENLVVDAYKTARPPAEQIVAIYPTEGTFWSDHPFAILDAPWVEADERAAAVQLEQFLRSNPIQSSALAFGFRPADAAIPVGAPIDAAHGVDPTQPRTLLEVPDAPTLRAVLALWERTKKTSDVVLVLDKSGSMRGDPLVEAKRGAGTFLTTLGDRDTVSLLFFDSQVAEPTPPVALGGGGRDAMTARIDGAIASGGTALYDAVGAAFRTASVRALAEPGRIHAVVVMTDGRDEHSTTRLDQLLGALATDDEAPVKVFTIAYGASADPTVLGQIADAGKGASATGDPTDIAAVFVDMAAFF